MIECNLPSAPDTDALGERLAQTRPARAVVYLHGDLGAGKSTLARALLRALGVVGTIRSPTYTLLERYPLDDGSEAWHLDLYRIADSGELDFLGLDGDEASLWLVEWPERGRDHLPLADLLIELEVSGNGRRARLHPRTETGVRWCAAATELPSVGAGAAAS